MQTNESNSGESASITYGVYSVNNSAVVGKTVDEARQMFATKFGIPQDAAAFNGKTSVGGDYVIKEGDQLNWSRASGEKGAC